MNKYFCFLIGLLLALTLTGTALAQDVRPQHTAPDWQVAYWNNTTLSGPPAAQLNDPNLDHSWGVGSPTPGVNADQFSARWLRYIDAPPGNYQISVTADDGVRVWVDNELLIDQWREQSANTYTAPKYLGAGHHLIRVEYFELYGGATIKLSWFQGTTPPPPPPPAAAWRGEYYNNKSLSGPPAVVRDEPGVNFYWGGGSPALGVIDVDGFSARWSQSIDLPPGNYHFTMAVDDGARLFVNGHTLIDAWKDQSFQTYTGDIYLPGGSTMIQMEYYENMGGAAAQLSWTSGNTPPPPPPPADAFGLVTAYSLNVRSGPGLNCPVLTLLYRGEQVRLLGRNNAGTWLKVESPYNSQGWVFGYYIRSNTPIYNLPVIQY